MNTLRALIIFTCMLLSLPACGGGSGGGDDAAGGGAATPGETAEMKTAAAEVEAAFVSGVPANVLTALSPESRAFYGDGIEIIAPDMVAFGNDFKTRKLIYATENYAEYAFTSNNETYTVAFARQQDGTWKMTRF